MRTKTILITLLLAGVFLAACGTTTPTAQPAEPTSTQVLVPTEAPPQSSGDPVWDRVQAAGKIVVGTSADYQPFEYYDANFEITGFDPDLARSLGAQLGLEVELVDIAFEGLPTALQIGQIDAAIAAISVTPERQALMDFTNVYYTGQDEILAKAGSTIGEIVTAAQMAQYRVGVQRGSVYASWLQNTLVNSGLMPETNFLQYAKAVDAIRDLQEGRNNLVILDKLAADEYILSGSVESVGRGLNTQLYAIALPKGSGVLQEQLNAALTALQNDGTVARLANTYLQINLPVVSAPQPTATAVPGPTPTPEPCSDAMQFVSDIQITAGERIDPEAKFTKIWRIKNTGTCTWDKDYKLVHVQGNTLRGQTTAITTEVKPGNTYDMVLALRAPNAPGDTRGGTWQLVNPDGEAFGERLAVKIKIRGNTQPTAVPPTATAVPPVQPTQVPGPVIDSLAVSAGTIQQGQTVLVSWTFSGSSLVSARLTRTNPDGSSTQLNNGADVSSPGQYQDTLNYPGNFTYTLKVSSESGSPAVKTVVVKVEPAGLSSDILGNEWVLNSLINPVKPETILTPLEGTELTITFAANGSLNGTTGCNPYNGTYQVSMPGDLDILDDIVVGKATCEEQVAGQEALFLDLLKSVVGIELKGKDLILKADNPTKEGTVNVLTFKK